MPVRKRTSGKLFRYAFYAVSARATILDNRLNLQKSPERNMDVCRVRNTACSILFLTAMQKTCRHRTLSQKAQFCRCPPDNPFVYSVNPPLTAQSTRP
jgi:hypothetical protein